MQEIVQIQDALAISPQSMGLRDALQRESVRILGYFSITSSLKQRLQHHVHKPRGPVYRVARPEFSLHAHCAVPVEELRTTLAALTIALLSFADVTNAQKGVLEGHLGVVHVFER